MAIKNLYKLPDIINGFELDPENSWFSVVIPDGGDTNLDKNPSFELNMAGVIAVNSAPFWLSSVRQRRGVWSIYINTTGLTDSGIYKTVTLQANMPYTWSIDFLDEAKPGRTYWMYIADSSGNRLSRIQEVKSTGFWQRPWVNYAGDATGGTRRLYFIHKGTNPSPGFNIGFYLDGSCVVAKKYPGIYFDGDSKGFVSNQITFFWNGLPHASTSTRKLDTGAGGKEMNLLELGLRITAIIGLGLGSFNHIATPMSTGGSFYQRSLPQERAFTLVGRISEFDLPALDRIRSSLLAAFSPDRLPTQQPLLLRYHRADPCTGEETDTFNIPCVYQSGLEGSVDNKFQQDVTITFKQYLPVISLDGEAGSSLNLNTDILAGRIFSISPNGSASTFNGGVSETTFGNAHDAINAIAFDQDGKLYVGGRFTDIGSLHNAKNIAYWDGTYWQPLLNGVFPVNALVFGPDSNLYVGGDYAVISGVPYGIAKFNKSSWEWESLGTGLSPSQSIYTLTFGPDGNLYAGGRFSAIGGVSANNVAMWNGTTWSALGNGLNNDVRSLTFGPNGNLYAGGAFGASGSTTIRRLAQWNGTTWSTVGATSVDNPGSFVNSLLFAQDGNLYAAGEFTSIGGVSANNIAMWNGTTWSPLGAGADTNVSYLGQDKTTGDIYATGGFTTIDGLPCKGGAVFNGTTWRRLSYSSSSDFTSNQIGFRSMKSGPDGTLYFGFGTKYSPQHVFVYGTKSISNPGTSYSSPVFKFTGPGTIAEIRNNIQNKAVYANLTLLAGETVTFDFRSDQPTYTSSLKGDVSSSILAGSQTDIKIVPGDNIISLLFTGTTSASSATVDWTPSYETIDDATH